MDGDGVKIVDDEIHEFIKPLYNEVIEIRILEIVCIFCTDFFQVKEKLIKSNTVSSSRPGDVRVGNMIKEGKEVRVV